MTTGRTRGAKTGRGRRAATVLVAMAPAFVALAFASASSAATLQVCPHGCQYSQIAAAVAAARSGDHVTVAAGTYQGGFTIGVSLTLAGAGAKATIIRGGGPVVTVGAGGSSKLDVAISGVTITGGIARSSPESDALYGKAGVLASGGGPGVLASGGGIEITPDIGKNAKETPGATVAVSNSIITANSVTPTMLVPSPSGAQCPGGTCKFAAAFGGGIYNAGDLTLTSTTVTDNSSVSTFASDAAGGGIYNEMGSLTVINSTISDNRTGVTAPTGRYADGGAIVNAGGTLMVRGSSITDNSASTITAWPSSVDPEAHGGAIHVEAGNATISHTKITGNTVKMTNSVGAAFADSGGLKADVAMTVTDDVIADNHVVVAALGSGSADGDSGAGELTGTVTGTRLTGNTVTVSAGKGDALASSGASLITVPDLIDSVVSGNHVRAISTGGSATAVGGAIQLGGMTPGQPAPETLRNTPVSGNTVAATGRTATAQGGGILNINVPNGPPGGALTLINSNVTNNTLSGSAKAKLQGGAVFTTFKLTLTNSALTANTPGECAGKGC